MNHWPTQFRGLVVLATALVGALPNHAFATTFPEMTLGERAEFSAAAFAGRLAAREVVLSEGVPTTSLHFDEVKWAFGGGNTKTSLTFEGGTVGLDSVHVFGMPVFEEGYSYVVLLNGSGDTGIPITAGEQGVWQVVETRFEDELLVDARGCVLLMAASGRLLERNWFARNASGQEIASSAPDFQRPLSVNGFLRWLSETRGSTGSLGVEMTGIGGAK